MMPPARRAARVLVCSHSRISGRTHARGAAARWVSYICRTDAVLFTRGAHMPGGSERRFVLARERHLAMMPHRRIADRFMATLPRGASPEQIARVIDGFIARLGRLRGGPGAAVLRFPYLAAVHALGRDADNPHVHLLLIDEDIDRRQGNEPHTGPVAIGCSDKGSTERFRQAWADTVNEVVGEDGAIISALSYRRLAAQARKAGDLELAGYYEACDAVRALHIGPAAAAAVRAKRDVLAPHLQRSAQVYAASYFARTPQPKAASATSPPPSSASPAASTGVDAVRAAPAGLPNTAPLAPIAAPAAASRRHSTDGDEGRGRTPGPAPCQGDRPEAQADGARGPDRRQAEAVEAEAASARATDAQWARLWALRRQMAERRS